MIFHLDGSIPSFCFINFRWVSPVIYCLKDRISPHNQRFLSDLRFHPQALSVNVGNPCGFPSPRSKGPQRAKPFRASATTLKFRVSSPLLAKLHRARELENFNFNLSGSDPVVANRAGVILPYDFFLSTKKCTHVRKKS